MKEPRNLPVSLPRLTLVEFTVMNSNTKKTFKVERVIRQCIGFKTEDVFFPEETVINFFLEGVWVLQTVEETIETLGNKRKAMINSLNQRGAELTTPFVTLCQGFEAFTSQDLIRRYDVPSQGLTKKLPWNFIIECALGKYLFTKSTDKHYIVDNDKRNIWHKDIIAKKIEFGSWRIVE